VAAPLVVSGLLLSLLLFAAATFSAAAAGFLHRCKFPIGCRCSSCCISTCRFHLQKSTKRSILLLMMLLLCCCPMMVSLALHKRQPNNQAAMGNVLCHSFFNIGKGKSCFSGVASAVFAVAGL